MKSNPYRRSGDAASGERLRRVVAAWREISGSDPDEATPFRGGRHAFAFHLSLRNRSPSSVVAKMRPHGELDLERAVHEVVLPQLGVPTPRFLGFHAGGADEGDVLFLEHVGSTRYQPSEPAHQSAAGRWLGRCHGASVRASIPAPIPRRSRERDRAELPGVLTRLSTLANPTLGEAGRSLVSRALELLDTATRVWPEWAERTASVPSVFTHGAFISRNVRMRGEGNSLVTLPFDWEHAAVRSPAVDLAQTPGRFGGFAANASLVEYHAGLAAAGVALDADVVSDVARMGTVIRATSCIDWLVPSLASEHVKQPLSELEMHCRSLEAVFSG